jgi:hypothetical protein
MGLISWGFLRIKKNQGYIMALNVFFDKPVVDGITVNAVNLRWKRILIRKFFNWYRATFHPDPSTTKYYCV